MVGQRVLLGTFTELVNREMLPRFIILVGPKGSGKKTLADTIPGMFKGSDILYTLPDVRVDTIRGMIEQSYKTATRTFYIIPDADNMSLAAKNALLKVTEEPPNNAYFIMTLEDENNTLDTIRSRGTIFRMEQYSAQDIGDYYVQNFDASLNDIILDICETPGEVNLLKANGEFALYDYANLVIDNIAECSGANSFKIGSKIAFKDEPDKFDLRLFWKVFMKVCSQKMSQEHSIKYARGVQVTSKYLQQLRITGVNKQSTFDMWILAIRQEWM